MKAMCKGCFSRNISANKVCDLSIYCDTCHKKIMEKLCTVHDVGFDVNNHDLVTAVLHVGFLTLEENDEHMERLRKPDPTIEQAKSSLSDAQIYIKPINRTASLVTGIERND